MIDTEKEWDDLLNIRTSGRDDSNSNHINYPYEPTPYKVLERLVNSGYIEKKSRLIDYGCGKGRVSFFLAYMAKCKTIGVEYDSRLYEAACQNKSNCISGNRTEFICENAASFVIPKEAQAAVFFNPFSVEVLMSVVTRIRESLYGESNSEIKMIFYYPSDSYIAYLNNENDIELIDEINCKDIFNTDDPRERLLIYTLKV